MTEQPTPRRGITGRVVDAMINPIMDAVDVGEVIDQVDVDALVDRVDVDKIVRRVDIQGVVDRVDVDSLMRRVDVDALMDRVDVDALVGRVDVDELMQRVDIDALIARVDLQTLVDRIDLNATLARVDMNMLLQRTELGAVIARSTTGVFGQLLDAVRALAITIDDGVHGTIGRILRPKDAAPETPLAMNPNDRAVARQGRPAGVVSRFFAFLVDQFLIGLLFVFGLRLGQLALEVVTGRTFVLGDMRGATAALLFIWTFVYLAGSLANADRTIGMTLAGLVMVGVDGKPIGGRAATIRTLVMPLSFTLLGAGFLLGLLRRDRRHLHDLAGGTTIIYAWDARLARLRDDTITNGGGLFGETT